MHLRAYLSNRSTNQKEVTVFVQTHIFHRKPLKIDKCELNGDKIVWNAPKINIRPEIRKKCFFFRMRSLFSTQLYLLFLLERFYLTWNFKDFVKIIKPFHTLDIFDCLLSLQEASIAFIRCTSVLKNKYSSGKISSTAIGSI